MFVANHCAREIWVKGYVGVSTQARRKLLLHFLHFHYPWRSTPTVQVQMPSFNRTNKKPQPFGLGFFIGLVVGCPPASNSISTSDWGQC